MKKRLFNIFVILGLLAGFSMSVNGQERSNIMIIISPENFPQKFPGNIGQTRLLIFLSDNTSEFHTLERGNKTIYVKSPIKDAYVVFGGQEFRKIPCTIETSREAAKVGVLRIKYKDEKGKEGFSCVLSK